MRMNNIMKLNRRNLRQRNHDKKKYLIWKLSGISVVYMENKGLESQELFYMVNKNLRRSFIEIDYLKS